MHGHTELKKITGHTEKLFGLDNETNVQYYSKEIYISVQIPYTTINSCKKFN